MEKETKPPLTDANPLLNQQVTVIELSFALARLKTVMEELFPPHEGFTEAFDTLRSHRLILQVPADQAFKDEWGEDEEHMWVWAWHHLAPWNEMKAVPGPTGLAGQLSRVYPDMMEEYEESEDGSHRMDALTYARTTHGWAQRVRALQIEKREYQTRLEAAIHGLEEVIRETADDCQCGGPNDACGCGMRAEAVARDALAAARGDL